MMSKAFEAVFRFTGEYLAKYDFVFELTKSEDSAVFASEKSDLLFILEDFMEDHSSRHVRLWLYCDKTKKTRNYYSPPQPKDNIARSYMSELEKEANKQLNTKPILQQISNSEKEEIDKRISFLYTIIPKEYSKKRAII